MTHRERRRECTKSTLTSGCEKIFISICGLLFLLFRPVTAIATTVAAMDGETRFGAKNASTPIIAPLADVKKHLGRRFGAKKRSCRDKNARTPHSL